MATRARRSTGTGDDLFAARGTKRIPFDFVLDELADHAPRTRPMFGCTSVYLGEKIVLVLRDKPGASDNGVWLATTREHHPSLRALFPSLRSITVLGPGETGWQLLPSEADDFEDSVLRLCALLREGDPRVGKIPKPKRPRGPGQELRAPPAKRKAAPKARARKKTGSAGG